MRSFCPAREVETEDGATSDFACRDEPVLAKGTGRLDGQCNDLVIGVPRRLRRLEGDGHVHPLWPNAPDELRRRRPNSLASAHFCSLTHGRFPRCSIGDTNGKLGYPGMNDVPIDGHD